MRVHSPQDSSERQKSDLPATSLPKVCDNAIGSGSESHSAPALLAPLCSVLAWPPNRSSNPPSDSGYPYRSGYGVIGATAFTSNENKMSDEGHRGRVARGENVEVISKAERAAVRRSLHRMVRSWRARRRRPGRTREGRQYAWLCATSSRHPAF